MIDKKRLYVWISWSPLSKSLIVSQSIKLPTTNGIKAYNPLSKEESQADIQ